MKDRVPTHPGRIRLTHVSDDLYDMSMADEPIEAGTPLSKATLLKDSTAAKYGFSSLDNPTPDDIFNAAFDYLPMIQLNNVWTSYRVERLEAQALSDSGTRLSGGTIGEYALFAGSGVADAYNSSLTKIAAQQLSVARNDLASARTNSYLIFAGGFSGNVSSAAVDAYDISLTRRTAQQLVTARHMLAGASVFGTAIFAGGSISGDSDPTATVYVDVYDDSLTRSTATPLDQPRSELAAVSTANRAVFAGGGSYSSRSNVVESYDVMLTHRVHAPLSAARQRLAGAVVGENILFCGGDIGASDSAPVETSVVDAYNSSLTKIAAPQLSVARFSLSAASIEGHAIFAGGTTTDEAVLIPSAAVESYNGSLSRTVLTELATPRSAAAGASVGDFALFAGGYSTQPTRDVDAYIMAYGLDITVPPWSVYHIDGITYGDRFTREGEDLIGALSTQPFNGYIKRSFNLSGKI